MKIIIQAGGKGTRLGKLTFNKPKCLVPVNNLPILFHTFKKFETAEFIIIGDYKYEVLKNYLETFANNINYTLIKAQGVGNICGISEALNYVNEDEQFVLMWSDLILSDEFDISNLDNNKSYVGISQNFECSWSLTNGKLEKVPSTEFGVAGFYIFSNKTIFKDIPKTGSFLGWLKDIKIGLTPLSMAHSKETGTLDRLNDISSTKNRCRPYNKMEFTQDKVIKTGITQEGQKLIEREIIWYEKMKEYGFDKIPKIYSLSPLTMEKINGTNIFNAQLTHNKKCETLNKLLDAVKKMHSYETKPANTQDLIQEYYTKTINRLESIRHTIPFSDKETIKINGRTYKNILYDKTLLENLVKSNLMDTIYCPIHGDCTLTNTMIDNNGEIYFIDARGYFGSQKVLGDLRYDSAKLYYSIVGSFDEFNIKNFDLDILEQEVFFKINTKGWNELEQEFTKHFSPKELDEIKQIHAIIWLSLASHCFEDYDSMCLAFYNGTYLINEFLGDKNGSERKTVEAINS